MLAGRTFGQLDVPNATLFERDWNRDVDQDRAFTKVVAMIFKRRSGVRERYRQQDERRVSDYLAVLTETDPLKGLVGVTRQKIVQLLGAGSCALEGPGSD